MPVLRRYVRVSPNQSILARIFIAPDELEFFTKSIPSSGTTSARLNIIINALYPAIQQHIKEFNGQRAININKAVGNDKSSQQQSTLSVQPDANESSLRRSDIQIIPGSIDGETIVRCVAEGWECSMFLVRGDQMKPNVMLIKDISIMTQSKERKADGTEVIDLESGSPSTGSLSAEEKDIKPQVKLNYTGYNIYGKLLYLVARRTGSASTLQNTSNTTNSSQRKSSKETSTDTSQSLPDNPSTDQGNAMNEIRSPEKSDIPWSRQSVFVNWIGASQQAIESQNLDFEER
ncbi:hypothetical protein V1511DRAFT_508193 [Dipodascopsis uninucleata]